MTHEKQNRNRKVLKSIGVFVIIAAVIAAVSLPGLLSGKKNSKVSAYASYEVQRGDLTVSVTESGSIAARQSVDIKSEVEGRTTIISIVDEGTYITQQDVDEGKILVELDSSNLKKQLNQQEITFASVEAAYTEAKESYGIQKLQNESNISVSKLTVRFTLIDLKKYLGESIAAGLVNRSPDDPTLTGFITLLIKDPALGGEAKQNNSILEAKISLAQETAKQAESKLSWSERLFAKAIISRIDLERDQLTKQRSSVEVSQAVTALALFKKYEFPKAAEKFLSDHHEALRELERTQAQTRAMLAQAEAKLNTAELTYELQKEQLETLQKQLVACIIKAPTVGLVIYGSSGSSSRYRSSESRIELGAEVYQRQKILSIPNTSEMSVDTKVHETSVDKVRPGQRAVITLDAFPDIELSGKVVRVAPLPDSSRSWLNPGIKVYNTQVSIDGSHKFLKPGMSAKVSIIVEELNDVLYVPLQAVTNRDGNRVCFINDDEGLSFRKVVTGAFNEHFIVINEGLQEGDSVSLNPPRMRSQQMARMAKKGQPQDPKARSGDLREARSRGPREARPGGPREKSSPARMDREKDKPKRPASSVGQ